MIEGFLGLVLANCSMSLCAVLGADSILIQAGGGQSLGLAAGAGKAACSACEAVGMGQGRGMQGSPVE